MKTCVSSYSFGRYASEESLGVLGIIDKAAELGFDAIEFTEGLISLDTPDEKINEIKKRADDAGIALAAYCVYADFVNGSDGKPFDEVERLKTQVNFAAKLGIPMMRHDITGGISGRKYARGYDDALKIVVEPIRALADYAESVGVKTMTENHGYFSQDGNRVEKLINSVAHPNFGALVDVGNFMCADETPNISTGIMAPYAFHVHAKDFHFKPGNEIFIPEGWFRTRGGNFLRGAIIGHGDANVLSSLRALKFAGYDGYVSIEFEGIEDNLLGLRLGLANLKNFIGML